RLGLIDRHVALRIVDLGQYVPLLDDAAAVDVQRLDEARNLGVQKGELEGANRPRLVGGPFHPAPLPFAGLDLRLVAGCFAPRDGVLLPCFRPEVLLARGQEENAAKSKPRDQNREGSPPAPAPPAGRTWYRPRALTAWCRERPLLHGHRF